MGALTSSKEPRWHAVANVCRMLFLQRVFFDKRTLVSCQIAYGMTSAPRGARQTAFQPRIAGKRTRVHIQSSQEHCEFDKKIKSQALQSGMRFLQSEVRAI
jgi:hypothetical protein